MAFKKDGDNGPPSLLRETELEHDRLYTMHLAEPRHTYWTGRLWHKTRGQYVLIQADGTKVHLRKDNVVVIVEHAEGDDGGSDGSGELV